MNGIYVTILFYYFIKNNWNFFYKIEILGLWKNKGYIANASGQLAYFLSEKRLHLGTMRIVNNLWNCGGATSIYYEKKPSPSDSKFIIRRRHRLKLSYWKRISDGRNAYKINFFRKAKIIGKKRLKFCFTEIISFQPLSLYEALFFLVSFRHSPLDIHLFCTNKTHRVPVINWLLAGWLNHYRPVDIRGG